MKETKQEKESDNDKIFLGNPVIDDFSENAHRVRRNLLIFSSIALFWKLGGLKVKESEVSLFGFGFDGITDLQVSIGLFVVVFYHFLHFTFFVAEHSARSRVRLSGRFVNFTGSFGAGEIIKKENTDLYQAVRSVVQGSNPNNKLISQAREYVDNGMGVRLARFEKGYKAYKLPERMRWIVIEYTAPFVVGFASLVSILFF